MYNGGFSSERDQWSPSVDYSDRSSKKFKWIFLFGVATLLLVLSVAALVIVFAVPTSWFSDNFRPNTTRVDSTNYTNRYGLWRLCFYVNETCESWFITEGASAIYIDQRLNLGRGKKQRTCREKKEIDHFSLQSASTPGKRCKSFICSSTRRR